MAIAMVAMLAFGGTYAYFTATATENSATIKTGYVGLIASELATDSHTITVENVFPGDVLLENPVTLTAETSDETGVYVAIKFVVEGVEDIADLFALDTTKWQETSEGSNTFVYISAKDTPAKLTDGTSATVLSSITLDKTVTGTPSTQDGTGITDGSLQNKTITVNIQAGAVQTSNYTDATVATIATAIFG